MPARRQPIHAPSAPSEMAPQMPRPPSQIFSGVDRVAALAPVGAGRGDDVVEPAADDAEQHRPGGDVEGLARLARRAAPAGGR